MQPLLRFIHHRRSFQMQPLILHQLPLLFFLKMQIKESHCQIPLKYELKHLTHSMQWQQRVFSEEAFYLSNWRSRLTSLPPLPLHSSALLLLFLLPPSQCVAMETATWVCCSCLSFRCKRCTTHLTISWWMEGWWLRGTVRCLVARRTTFSLCRYSTTCAWRLCKQVSTKFCLAACSFFVQPVPGHA